MPREEQHIRRPRVRLGNDRTQMRTRFCREVFIRIDKYDPIPRDTGERRIACGGKVVLPWDVINRRPHGRRHRRRAVRRARINDNPFIHRIAQTLHGLPQMFRIIADNIARRNPKPIVLHRIPLPSAGLRPRFRLYIHVFVDLRKTRRNAPCNRIVEKRGVRTVCSARRIAIQRRRKVLRRLRITPKPAENHPALCMEIGQMRKPRKRLLRNRQHLLIGIVERTHGLDHLMIDPALIPDEAMIAVESLLRECEGTRIVLFPKIAVRKVEGMACRPAVQLCIAFQQGNVAPDLRRPALLAIARMSCVETRIRIGENVLLPVVPNDLLMNRTRIVHPDPPKDPRAALIDGIRPILRRQKAAKRNHQNIRIGCHSQRVRNARPHLLRMEEILVRIKEYHIVPRRMAQCLIPRHREIVLPHDIVEIRMMRCGCRCDSGRPRRRNDDPLVRRQCGGRKRTA